MSEQRPEHVSVEEETARRIAQFRFSVDLFERNYTELVALLDYLCSPSVAFSFSWTNERWLLHEGMKEVQFLLHDFVAAAKSLIDHTRVLYKQLYEAEGLIPDYQEQIEKRFARDPLTQFVIKLREMSQHYRLPAVGIHVEASDIKGGVSRNTEIQMQLNVSDLDHYAGWTAPAQEFLKHAGSTIDLREVVERYFEHISDFQHWFSEAQRNVHGRLPDLYERFLLHGAEATDRQEVRALEEAVNDLEARRREELTFKDVETAFAPVLNILDMRLLMLCRHDSAVWLHRAMRAVKRRFDIPAALEARIRRLFEKSATPASEGG